MTEKIFYHEMSWPEIKSAIEKGKIPILPVGSVEQHGPHLPLITDAFTAFSICVRAAEISGDLLVMPPIYYGYSTHHMDFPGTISIKTLNFMGYIYDVCRSLVHHGFRKIIIFNGHGGNVAPLQIVARRISEETDSLCALISWWNLAREEISKLRESEFPGGMAHSCELETSVMLSLKPEYVRMEKAVKDIGFPKSNFIWLDIMGQSPVYLVEGFSRFSRTGIVGDPTLATAEKGEKILSVVVQNLVRFVAEFKAREVWPRVNHH
ncbi:MAG: creatininase family protein [Candidatus Bathyarchaeia archaeon]|nr:creatininase family protein [Candidatus Bathyarchaeota archaeon]